MKRSESLLMRGRHVVVALVITATMGAGSAQAQQQTESREHQVKAGDTLWDLARLYLANPYLWPLIYEANRNVVENPHRIYPLERLIIPGLPGEVPVEAEGGEPVTYTQSPRTRFYRPLRPNTDPGFVGGGETALHRVAPSEYHAAPWIGDTVAILGEVYRSTDPRQVGDRLGHTFHPYSQMIAGYVQAARPAAGQQLLVVHIGREIEGWGRLIEPRGVVRVDSLFETTMVATVTHEFGPLRTGDVLIPMDSFPVTTAAPVDVANGPEGFLIDVQEPQPLVGTHDIAFVNLGRTQNVSVGDEVLAIVPELVPERSRPEVLPRQGIARMLVTKVRERTATVRVLSLEHAALVPGMPVRLVARMSQ